MTSSMEYDKLVAEEYKIWRKNVPYNYDLLITHALSWPSLTCQFFPTCERSNNLTTQNILLSTHTSGVDKEYITIISVTLPDEITDAALEKYHGKFDSYGDAKVKIVQEIPVLDEINKARYCPFATNVIAARSDKAEIHIYDSTKHSSNEKEAKPDLHLRGHEKGGFGVSWNVNKNGYLLTSGDDGFICLFDINKELESTTVNCIEKYMYHSSAVNDCSFNYFNNSFASVGDDKKIVFGDIRDKNPRIRENAHECDVLCISYSSIDENIVATGGQEGKIKIWDERNMEAPLYTFDTGSGNQVLQVSWSPHMSNLVAAGGTNRKVGIYDLSRVGMELKEEEKLDGPPELLFLHGGHTDILCDIAWNPLEPYEIASVAEDNILQLWQMTTSEIPYDLDD